MPDGRQREFRIETGKGRIFAKAWNLETGTEPIILFHDSLGCVEVWRDFPLQLARITRRSVIAYDRLGFGKSDAYPGALPLSFVRDEARGAFSALLNSLGVNNFIAFGHSVGGGMAVVTAGLFPGRCRALITESAQAFVEDRTLEGIRQAERGFREPGQMPRLQRYHGDKAEWVLRAWTGTWLSEGFASWALDEDLPKVRCPVLALHGAKDEYGSAEHPRRIASLSSGPATMKILENCGHLPHREQEAAVLDAVTDFLRESAQSLTI